MTSKNYLREPVASEILKAQKQTLRNWRHLGVGPPYRKIGRNVLYEEGELLAWVESQRVEPGPLRGGHADE